MVLDNVIFVFVTTLGSPAANTVQVLIQDNLSSTVKKLAEAIRGVQDTANIAYGSGTNPHPTCTGYWTKQRFSIGDISVAPGESLFLLEKSEDTNNHPYVDLNRSIDYQRFYSDAAPAVCHVGEYHWFGRR